EETSTSSKSVMEDFTSQQEEIFGELTDKAEELKQAITDIAELVDTTSDTADTAKDTLVEGVELTTVGVGTVIGILDDIKDILGGF
ncbi:MAG: apolipoprotein acyltransferase, partial [Cyanobacteria bacterium J06631_2]